MVTKVASEFFDTGALGLPIVDKPINAAPAAGFTVGSQKPVLTSSGYSSLYGRPMAAAEYIVYDATGTVILQQSGVLTPVGGVPINSWPVPVDLPLNTNYMWSHKFKSTFGEEYVESAKTTFTVPTSTVGVPTILSPAEDSVPASLTFDVQGSDFVTLGVAQSHDETTLEVATTSDFLTGLQTIVKSSGDLTVVNVTVPTSSTQYFIRMKYRGDSTGYSSVSPTTSITSVADSVATPSIITPANFATGQQASLAITSTAFVYNGSLQTHEAAEWEIYLDSDLVTLFYTSGETTLELTSLAVLGLIENTTYYVRKRDKGNLSGFSEWSATSHFTTALVFSDWLGWDQTNDGIPLQLNTSALSQLYTPKNGASLAEVSYQKYLCIQKSGTVTSKVHLVGVDGLSISESGSVNASITQGSSCLALSPELGIYYACNNAGYMQEVAINGASISIGTSYNIAASAVVATFYAVPLTATKFLTMYSNGGGIYFRFVTATGGAPTLGTELNKGSSYQTPVVDATHDLLGDKLVLLSGSGATLFVTVYDVDDVGETVTEVANTSDSLFQLLRGAHARWLDSSTIAVVTATNSTVPNEALRLAIYKYDGASSITLQSEVQLEYGASSFASASMCKIDSENIMILTSDAAVDKVFAQHVKIVDNFPYLSERLQVADEHTEASWPLEGMSQIAVDSSRVLTSVLGVRWDPSLVRGHTIAVLNGLAAN